MNIKRYKTLLVISVFLIGITWGALNLPKWMHRDYDEIRIKAETEEEKAQSRKNVKLEQASETPVKKIEATDQQDRESHYSNELTIEASMENSGRVPLEENKKDAVNGKISNKEEVKQKTNQEHFEEKKEISIEQIENNVEPPTQLNENDPNDQGTKVKDQWVQEKIDANRENISDGDLNVGAEIYNRLDTAYIYDLLSEGLTDQEKKALDDYMHQELSDGEYNQVLQLIEEYKGLVQ